MTTPMTARMDESAHHTADDDAHEGAAAVLDICCSS
uniref:Uncharacterized protein n=1 Tax=Anguilla anguilla TaxID=7936 RepID=A0A0E9XZQ0_ANGAN